MSLLNVEALHLEQGDVIVVYTPTGLPLEQRKAISEELRAIVPEHPAIILASGWSVDKLTRGDLEELIRDKGDA